MPSVAKSVSENNARVVVISNDGTANENVVVAGGISTTFVGRTGCARTRPRATGDTELTTHLLPKSRDLSGAPVVEGHTRYDRPPTPRQHVGIPSSTSV